MTFQIRRLLVLLLLVAAPTPLPAADPNAALESLVAAERGFADAAAQAPSGVDALAPMLDEEAIVPIPGRGLVVGREAVLAAYRESPAWRGGPLAWAPIRAGISADGTQGFSYGVARLAAEERQYLAYWVRRPEGWRVLAYRQVRRAAGTTPLDGLPSSLPGFAVPPTEDPAVIEAHRRSLAAAEQHFSDDAQQVGLREAFRAWGREDAMNMHGPAGFRVGLDAITAGLPEGATSPVRWSTERAFVASSGDLGVSIGTIRLNGPVAEGQPASLPFFTVWRREAPGGPWRYIAE